MEGVFGTGKTAYGLGRISVRLEETTRCVIGVALLLMNLMKGLISALTPLNADQRTVVGPGGEAHIRQPLRKVGIKAVLLRHKAPVLVVPEVDIQLCVGSELDLMLLEIFAPAIIMWSST